MIRWIPLGMLAALILASPAARAALNKPLPAVVTQLAVDGVACGAVTNWQGGDMAVTVQAMTIGDERPQSMNVAGMAVCRPVSFEIPFPCPKPVMDLIQDMCLGGAKRSTLQLVDMPVGTTNPALALEISGAFITEVRFPAFSSPAREIPVITLVLQGDSSRTLTAAPPASGDLSRRVAISSFVLEIPGIDAEGVTRFEPFTLKRSTTTANASAAQQMAYYPGKPENPRLFGIVALENSQPFLTWRDAAVSARSLSPLDATLTLRDSTARPVIMFHLSRLGMVGIGVVPNKATAVRKMQVEFSVEHITLEQPATPSPQPGGIVPRGASARPQVRASDDPSAQPPPQLARALARSDTAASSPR